MAKARAGWGNRFVAEMATSWYAYKNRANAENGTKQLSAPRMQSNSERMAGCVVAVHHNDLKHTYDSSEVGLWSLEFIQGWPV